MKAATSILIIDDDKQICFALGALFKYQGWQPYAANNVRDGVQFFKKASPQLVLIDYHMPGVNGVEGVRQLRRLSRTVPIVVLTVDESQSVADEFLEAGASDFALKPIKAPDIVSRIKLHLRLLEMSQEPQEASLAKGLSQCTLDIIRDFFSGQPNALTVNDVANGTGLAYQTVYRYLQHMVQQQQIEAFSVYGKVGRPKQLFRKISQ